VCLRGPGGRLDRLVRHVGNAEGDVGADAGREEEGVLRDDPDLAPQGPAGNVADVHAVDRDAATRDVVEARHKRGERRLPGAGPADERDRAAGSDLEVDVLDHGSPVLVGEVDVLERDAAGAGWQRHRVRPVGDLLRLVDHLEEALAGGRGALRLADPHAEHAERQHEHVEQ